jgi:hypothetical protein
MVVAGAIEHSFRTGNATGGSEHAARFRPRPDKSWWSDMMKHKTNTILWIGMAFGVSLGLAITVLCITGTDTKSIQLALQLTARWAFLPFWMAYAGRAMAELFGPILEPLARRGREFGLAYAAALLVHLGLVVSLFLITSRPPLTGVILAIFLVGAVCTYLLAVFSFGGLAKVLGSTGWYALRIVGMNYILFAFALDFVRVAAHGPAHYGRWRLVEYAPFAAMSVAAPLLVLAAAAHRRLEKRYNHVELQPVSN